MSTNRTGICHICGNDGPLSYEHIPPRSMGNSKPVKSYRVADIAEKHGSTNVKFTNNIHYRQHQRGMGFQTICRKCNSYLGRHYVKAYTGCISELGALLQEAKNDKDGNGIHLEARNIPVLAFIKHVISNFCSTTQPGTMLDCRDFLLDCENRNLPDRYRLFMFAVPENGTFISSGWAQLLLNERGLKTANLAFIATYPVGFFLYDTESSSAEPDSSRYGCEITSMTKQPWGAEPNFSIDLPYMTISNSFPTPISQNLK